MPDLPEVHLHPVGPADWRSHRDLRLQMLLDAPDAFWSTHADQSDRDREWWLESLAGAWVLQARIGDRPVGSVTLRPGGQEHDGAGLLVAMYVAPEVRGRRVGELLVRAVLAEAAARGWPEVRLAVVTANTGAVRLYERCGFVPNGVRFAHPRREDLQEMEMTHRLT